MKRIFPNRDDSYQQAVLEHAGWTLTFCTATRNGDDDFEQIWYASHRHTGKIVKFKFWNDYGDADIDLAIGIFCHIHQTTVNDEELV